MKKAIISLIFSFVVVVAFGTGAKAQIPKEGTSSMTTAYSGTFKFLAMEKERVQMTYEITGVLIGDTSDAILHNASMRCIGSFHAVKGEYDNNSGFCVATRPDGDQAFWTYKTAGKMGRGAKGTTTFVGGTGKLTGIQGGSEYTQFELRPAAEGTFQGYNKSTGQYKLP